MVVWYDTLLIRIWPQHGEADGQTQCHGVSCPLLPSALLSPVGTMLYSELNTSHIFIYLNPKRQVFLLNLFSPPPRPSPAFVSVAKTDLEKFSLLPLATRLGLQVCTTHLLHTPRPKQVRKQRN